MKKSIVLLITLFFISTISVLIIKNLDDSDKFIKEANYDATMMQLFLATENIKSEVTRYLKEKAEADQDNFNEVLSNEIFNIPVSLNFPNIEATVSVQKLNFDDEDIYCNINDLTHKKSDNNISKKTFDYYEDLFITNQINDFYSFVEILDKKKDSISNYKQMESIINTFIAKTDNNSIDKIKDMFYLKRITQNDILCRINTNSSDIKTTISFTFNTKDKGIDNIDFIIKR